MESEPKEVDLSEQETGQETEESGDEGPTSPTEEDLKSGKELAEHLRQFHPENPLANNVQMCGILAARERTKDQPDDFAVFESALREELYFFIQDQDKINTYIEQAVETYQSMNR